MWYKCGTTEKLKSTKQGKMFGKQKKKHQKPSFSVLFVGGDKRDRTADLLNAIYSKSDKFAK